MSDALDIVERLRACADDPMWAHHAEIPKRWCDEAADEITRLRRWKSTHAPRLAAFEAAHKAAQADAEAGREAAATLASERAANALLTDEVERLRALSAQPAAVPPSIDAAHAIGAKGGPVVEAERLAFEAWVRGHCWALSATWTGTQYLSDAEQGGNLDPRAMATRRMWAAWRDRAALAAAPQAPQQDNSRDERQG